MTVKAFKVGGLRFLRLGRLQLSFCIVRRKPTAFHIVGRTYLVLV